MQICQVRIFVHPTVFTIAKNAGTQTPREQKNRLVSSTYFVRFEYVEAAPWHCDSLVKNNIG